MVKIRVEQAKTEDVLAEHISSEQQTIVPDWCVPGNIKSLLTTRCGGWSQGPYHGFNLATHVGDDNNDVIKNRQFLAQFLPASPVWLNQIHGISVIDAGALAADRKVSEIDADGSYTTKTNVVSVVLTADCLPVLLCTRQGDGVAALHAGWKGLLNGILEQGIANLIKATKRQAEDLLVWLGPAIGPEKFEVGEEVRQMFLKKTAQTNYDIQQTELCFVPLNDIKFENSHHQESKWLADIYQLARIRLSQQGVENVSGGNYCTYKEKDTFYSYRRDGITGRMASMIWIENVNKCQISK